MLIYNKTIRMTMPDSYMTYYAHLAKLTGIANKQTMFLSHLLYHMTFNDELKMCIVDLTATRKREILKAIGAKSNDCLRLASVYIAQLSKHGLIKSIGGGRYVIAPESYSYGKYIPKELRAKSGRIYQMQVFQDNDMEIIETYVITDDGEKLHISDLIL